MLRARTEAGVGAVVLSSDSRPPDLSEPINPGREGSSQLPLLADQSPIRK